MTTRRLPATKAAPRLENQRAEEELYPCTRDRLDREAKARLNGTEHEPTPYDVLLEHPNRPGYALALNTARTLCGRCPIQTECLSRNANAGEAWAKIILGINPRGGAPKGPVPPCGTDKKFWWHRRNGEVACDPCKAANNAYKRELRAKRRDVAA